MRKTFGYGNNFKITFSSEQQLEDCVSGTENWFDEKKKPQNVRKCNLLHIRGIPQTATNTNVNQAKVTFASMLLAVRPGKITATRERKKPGKPSIKQKEEFEHVHTHCMLIRICWLRFSNPFLPLQGLCPSWKTPKRAQVCAEQGYEMINGQGKTYKDRLKQYKLLPISHHIELHDILYFLCFLKRNDDDDVVKHLTCTETFLEKELEEPSCCQRPDYRRPEKTWTLLWKDWPDFPREFYVSSRVLE